MSVGKITLPSHVMAELRRDADALGLSPAAVLTADYLRWRAMATAAAPALDEWQWGLLSHILDGVEFGRLVHGDDSLPSGASIAGEIDAWADASTNDDDILRAGDLRQRVLGWTPLTIAGLLLRLRHGA